MEDSMEATVTTEEATKAARIWIRAFMRAANHIRDQRQAIDAQEAKIAEQTSLLDQRQTMLDRCNEAMKAQAFQLGRQDRELMQLRSKVAEQAATIDQCQVQLVNAGFQIDDFKATVAELQAALALCRECNNNMAKTFDKQEAKIAELQAGDVGRLRQTADFQAMEIQRLKAALWYGGKLDQVLIDILGTRPLGHEGEGGIACWCDPEMDKAIAAKLDAYKGKVAALTEDLAERDRLLRECQAERDEARRKLALKNNAALAAQKRIAELEAEVGALKGDAMIKTHYAAGLMDSVKAMAAEAERSNVFIAALQNDVARLKGIAEHSNNLAQNRLEEAARLRKELAVAREATANLEAKLGIASS